jgi:twitching motility two-component system response regulator PilH
MGLLDVFRSLFGGGKPEKEPPPAENASVENERRGRPRRDARDGTRALIIDDSRTVVAALNKFLRSGGFVTMEALDAEHGLEMARSERPDLIFLDIVLPGMNGFSALRILRKDPLTKDIPVIMMSGNEQATEQFFGSRIGADDFMKKPFSRAEILARVERRLDNDRVPRRRIVQPQLAGAVAEQTTAGR